MNAFCLIKYKSLILWKRLNVQREVIGPDCAISGTEPSSVTLYKLATIARQIYCDFKNYTQVLSKSKTHA